MSAGTCRFHTNQSRATVLLLSGVWTDWGNKQRGLTRLTRSQSAHTDFFLQLVPLELADYHGVALTLASLEHDSLYSDSPFWRVTNGTSIPVHEHVCVHTCSSRFLSTLCFACLLVFVSVLLVHTSTISGLLNIWRLNALACIVTWPSTPRTMTIIFQYRTSQRHNQTRKYIIVPPKLASLLSRVTGTFLSLALSLS